MQVTVNAAANIPPVANAGSDRTITLPINMLTVSGSGRMQMEQLQTINGQKYRALQITIL